MSKDKKLPALQFYPGDWRKSMDVQSLSFHDRGVWFEMLMLMHDSERRGVLLLNGVAMTDEMIARAIGLDNQTFNQTLSTLLTFGVASRDEETGAVMSRRMVRDENLRQIRTEAGSKGGNPVLLNQNTTTKDKQKSTPSSSSSSSSSEVLVSKTSSSHPGAKPGKVDPVEAIYRQYPRKIAPGTAFKAIKTAHKRLMNGESPLEPLSDRDAYAFLYRRVIAYARSPDGSNPDRSKVPHPATWFNRKSYLDDVTEWDSILTEGKKPAVVPLQQRIYTDPAEAHA